jgi:hypothetical protein
MVGYQQTTGYTCGPSAVMSVLAYYGALNASELNHATEMRIAAEMGTNPANGTDATNMAAWLARTYPDFSVSWGTDGSLAMLRKHLAAGDSVIVDWVDWGGHFVATLGYFAGGADPGEGKDTIYFADPAVHFYAPNPLGVSGFTSDRFAAMWISNVYPGETPTRNVYVLAKPRKSGSGGGH